MFWFHVTPKWNWTFDRLSGADQRRHQSSASLAFVWGFAGDRWIPRRNVQERVKCFHLMTSSCKTRMLVGEIWGINATLNINQILIAGCGIYCKKQQGSPEATCCVEVLTPSSKIINVGRFPKSRNYDKCYIIASIYVLINSDYIEGKTWRVYLKLSMEISEIYWLIIIMTLCMEMDSTNILCNIQSWSRIPVLYNTIIYVWKEMNSTFETVGFWFKYI